MRFPCRCRGCGKRKTLRKHPEEYQIIQKCVSCGLKSWRVDKYRMTKNPKDRGKMCFCDGYYHVHKYGNKYCRNREDWIIERSLEDKKNLKFATELEF